MTSHVIEGLSPRLRAFPARLLATQPIMALAALRVFLGVVMFPHGAQKLVGWFGGYGWSGTMRFFSDTIGLPGVLGAGIILFEFFGPLLLIAGLGTRALAAGFAVLMIGAIATVHAEHGFWMNWAGTQAGEGFEYHLLVIGICLALALAGGGRWSLDRKLCASRQPV